MILNDTTQYFPGLPTTTPEEVIFKRCGLVSHETLMHSLKSCELFEKSEVSVKSFFKLLC